MDNKTAQKQVSAQVDPLFNRAIDGVKQQKYQSDIQAGQVSAARGLGRSGLAADQLNKIAIASQGQIGDLNAQRAAQVAQMANDLVWRDKEYALQDRSQRFNEFNSNRTYDYQVGRDKVADKQWQTQFDYQKGRDKVADSQWKQQFDQDKKQFGQQYALSKLQYDLDKKVRLGQLSLDQAQFEFQKAQAKKRSAGGGGGSSRKGGSSSSSGGSKSNSLSTAYNQYQKSKKNSSKSSLDKYYENEQKKINKLTKPPYKNTVLKPVAPARNKNLTDYEKMKMFFG